MLYLIANGAHPGWFRLRWLKDIDRMFRHELDYKKVSLFSKNYQHQRLVEQALVLTNELLNCSIYAKFKSFSQSHHSQILAQKAIHYMEEIIQIYGEASEEILKYHKRYLLSVKSKSHKLMFIIISFYPNPLDESTLTLPKKLHLLYFPLRPFCGLGENRKNCVLEKRCKDETYFLLYKKVT